MTQRRQKGQVAHLQSSPAAMRQLPLPPRRGPSPQPSPSGEGASRPRDSSTPLRCARNDNTPHTPPRVRCPRPWIPAGAGMTGLASERLSSKRRRPISHPTGGPHPNPLPQERGPVAREVPRLRCAALAMTRRPAPCSAPRRCPRPWIPAGAGMTRLASNKGLRAPGDPPLPSESARNPVFFLTQAWRFQV